MFLKPVKTKFFNNSQPIPPAPITKTLDCKDCKKVMSRQVILKLKTFYYKCTLIKVKGFSSKIFKWRKN